MRAAIFTAHGTFQEAQADAGLEALRQARAEVARIHRVILLGEMAASIAHEVNQPIAAVVTSAGAGLRWLAAQPPHLEETREALDRITESVIGPAKSSGGSMPS